MLSAWDQTLALRAAAVAGIAALITLIIVATTDEGAPWAERIGMVAALAPIAGSLGTLSAIRIAAGRGELRTLATLGVDPMRAMRGAILGGVATALLGPALAASNLADLGGLFPRPVAGRVWVAEAFGMHELTQGFRLDSQGVLSLTGQLSAPTRALPTGAPFFTVAATALAALVCPFWTAMPEPPSRRLLTGTVAILLAIGAFQTVAAGRLSSVGLLGGPLILLIDSALARYRARPK